MINFNKISKNTSPLSVPVATVSLQTRSKKTSATPITAKGMSKKKWLLVHFSHRDVPTMRL